MNDPGGLVLGHFASLHIFEIGFKKLTFLAMNVSRSEICPRGLSYLAQPAWLVGGSNILAACRVAVSLLGFAVVTTAKN